METRCARSAIGAGNGIGGAASGERHSKPGVGPWTAGFHIHKRFEQCHSVDYLSLCLLLYVMQDKGLNSGETAITLTHASRIHQ